MIKADYDVDALIGSTSLEARPYQRRIVTKANKMFGGHYKNGAGDTLSAARSVMVTSPTGSGKTPIGLLTAKALQDQTDCLVAWVSMRKNLLKQAGRENAPRSATNPDGKGIGVRAEFVSMFSREVPETMRPQVRGSRKLLFIHDEAQHDAAASAAHLHNEFEPDWVLGLSATPYRTDRVKLPFEMVIEDAGIHELIQAGYLSEYDHYVIDDWKPETVMDMFAMDPVRWGPSLMFFNTFDQCTRALRRAQYHGLPFDVVTGSTDREEQIDDLKDGKVLGLINMAVLTEGFNYPDLQTVWVRDSGKGTTIQMGGRVFRKSAVAPVKQVVQSKGMRWTMPKTAMPRQQWVWEGGSWLTLKVNDQIGRIQDEVQSAMALQPDGVPKLFKDRAKKRPRRV
jgi:superfamily II DNA or RNA helicase